MLLAARGMDINILVCHCPLSPRDMSLSGGRGRGPYCLSILAILCVFTDTTPGVSTSLVFINVLHIRSLSLFWFFLPSSGEPFHSLLAKYPFSEQVK